MKSHRYDQVICFRSLARIFFSLLLLRLLLLFLLFWYSSLSRSVRLDIFGSRCYCWWCYSYDYGFREAFPIRNHIIHHYLHLILFALSHYFWLAFSLVSHSSIHFSFFLLSMAFFSFSLVFGSPMHYHVLDSRFKCHCHIHANLFNTNKTNCSVLGTRFTHTDI